MIGETEKYIVAKCDNGLKVILNDDKPTFASKKIKGDTLVYDLRKLEDCKTESYFFGARDVTTGDRICTYQSVLFKCATCSQSSMVNKFKSYGFKEVAPGQYLSKLKKKIELNIIFDGLGNPLGFYMVPSTLEKEVYLARYNAAK